MSEAILWNEEWKGLLNFICYCLLKQTNNLKSWLCLLLVWLGRNKLPRVTSLCFRVAEGPPLTDAHVGTWVRLTWKGGHRGVWQRGTPLGKQSSGVELTLFPKRARVLLGREVAKTLKRIWKLVEPVGVHCLGRAPQGPGKQGTTWERQADLMTSNEN